VERIGVFATCLIRLVKGANQFLTFFFDLGKEITRLGGRLLGFLLGFSQGPRRGKRPDHHGDEHNLARDFGHFFTPDSIIPRA
jgi:hypothetical protein